MSRRRGSFPTTAARIRLAVAATAVCVGPGPLVAQTGLSSSNESRALARAASAEGAGRIEEARLELEGVLDARPGSSSGLAMYAQLLTPRGRAADVLPRAERAVEENGPDDIVVMVVWIRTLIELGMGDSAVAVSERWVAERPEKLSAYREWSRALASEALDGEAADVLLTGRKATGSPDAFAQELSALLASAGDYAGAAEEWCALLGWGDGGVSAVLDRLASPDVDRERAVAALKQAVARGDYPVHVRSGALSLALRLEDRQWARAITEQIVGAVPAETRRLVLREYYVQTLDRSWADDAAWAALLLERDSITESERRHWRAMRADVSYLGGDSAEAERVFSDLTRSAQPGTETHRRSVRRLFSIRASEGAGEAESLLLEYAAVYPQDGAESVEMAIELSAARLSAGDTGGARDALELLPEPADAALMSRLEGQRGLLALYEGRPSVALEHLETAAFIPGGDPVRQTDALQLAGALERSDSVSAAALGKGMLALLADSDPDPILTSVEVWTSAGAPEASPTLVALAAAALEQTGFRREASIVREVLVSTYSASAEAPAALLSLGRVAMSAGAEEEARMWLERLVLEHPGHALAPVARNELAKLGDAP